MADTTILLLPGWQGSDAGHWQSRWEALHGDRRVEQHNWLRPLRGDWSARLEEEVLAVSTTAAIPPASAASAAPVMPAVPAVPAAPIVLVAHSLGCLLVAAWAAHTRHADRIRGAFLVAPADLDRDDLRQMIPGWSPIVRQPLPFPAVVVAAADDPYCAADRARGLAADWGARFIDAGGIAYAPGNDGQSTGHHAGHLNGDSGLGDWPEGRALLNDFLTKAH